MSVTRLIVGFILGALVATQLVFVYVIIKDSSKFSGYVESTVTTVLEQADNLVALFGQAEGDGSGQSANEASDLAANATAENSSAGDDNATSPVHTAEETLESEEGDQAGANTVTENGDNAESPPEADHNGSPTWKTYTILGPFDSRERAEATASFVSGKAGIDCFVISDGASHVVTIRYMDKLQFYIETIREATGLDVAM